MAGEMKSDAEAFEGFPTELKIGGKSFSIEYLGDTGLGGNMGNVDFSSQEIKIRCHCRDGMRDTLLHEILHVLFFVNGMEIEMVKGEVVVNMLAHGLDAVFVDNPKLVQLYAERSPKMVAETEKKLKEACITAIEDVQAVIEEIKGSSTTPQGVVRQMAYDIIPPVKNAKSNITKNRPRRASQCISLAYITWDGSLSIRQPIKPDKTGLSSALLAAQEAVARWVDFCNQRMEESKNG